MKNAVPHIFIPFMKTWKKVVCVRPIFKKEIPSGNLIFLVMSYFLCQSASEIIFSNHMQLVLQYYVFLAVMRIRI
jgi:hypothetical protein